jgi:hypothetical protein
MVYRQSRVLTHSGSDDWQPAERTAAGTQGDADGPGGEVTRVWSRVRGAVPEAGPVGPDEALGDDP